VKRTIAQAGEDPAAEPKYDSFTFEGEEIRVINGIPSGLPLMEFADAMAAADDDSLNMEALGAMYAMLQSCILPADWGRFRKAANRAGAGFDDLLPITQQVWAAVVGRFSQGPSDSQDGPSTTSTSSKASSPEPTGQHSPFKVDLPGQQPSAPDLRLLTPANEWTPPPGRPDLAVP
ncbi:hypothetical protein, partial [Streptomyces cuspidosporus]